MNNVEEIFSKSRNAAEFSRKYCGYLSKLLLKLNHTKINEIVNIFVEAERNGKTIYFLGNGGSAATSTHFACDLGKGTKTVVNRFKTQGLADNFATFTAYANDDGYDYVFSKQLENVLNQGDVIVCLSASGNSKNLINAVEYAKTVGARSISVLGFDGGKLKQISDVVLHIETPKGEYGPIEDIHMILDHIITTYIFMKMSKLLNKTINQ